MSHRPIRKHQVPEAFRAALRHHQVGELAPAEELYRQILQVEPKNADVLHLLGLVRDARGETGRAIELIEKAVRLEPRFATYRNSLGVALRKAGRLEDARKSYEKALGLKPDYAEAHGNLGNLLRQLGAPEEARLHCERAVALHPENFLYRNNLGGVLHDLGLVRDSVAAFEKALELKPDYHEAAVNLCGIYRELGRHREAAELPRKTLALNPADAAAHSDYLLALNYLSECSPEEIAAEHRRFGELHRAPARPAGSFPNIRDPERRLRIGYVSPDLRRHPVAFFLEPVLARHDRDRFEIACYSTRPGGDGFTERLRGLADRWTECSNIADAELARQIGADGIDILVDLAGHTAYNRLTLFALKPAPVQATWLGYFNTTGVGEIDYLLADRFSVHAGEEGNYVETVLRLPDSRFCYQPPAGAPEVAPPPLLSSGSITFGSFNNLAKLSPAVIAAWAKLLNRVAGSRLLLKWKTLGVAEIRRHYAELFAAHGIGPDRLELRGSSPHLEMLAEYADVDIALDPFPFCGGATSCEALWMGVPVVTLPGDRPAGRQTASFLPVIGLQELIAGNVAEYLDMVAGLAADRWRLAALRAGMRERMAGSPLCDARRFTANLESLYRDMWRRWCEGT
ncbi:tetratricopeptide repeat protein [Geobacter sp.]|uniref:O-linked N-acetylglucosamine transferase, SPINDLY family protein n=1 Tax=Geobacter sp. TaxID=46610 RepID=UPI00260679F6|nr:tetratricopeptide repeat protein [Geobacter sp.]